MNQSSNDPVEEKDARLQEAIVAYLDGELDVDERRNVECSLSEDPHTRSRLRDLQETWDLLDNLPSAQTDDAFTQTTLEMIANKASEDAHGQRNRWRQNRWLRWLGRGGSIAAAFVVGYFLLSTINDQQRLKQVADLPIIDRIEQFRFADDGIEFLAQLDELELFVEEDFGPSEDPRSGLIFRDTNLDAVRKRAENLTAQEKELLESRRERFEELPATQRNKYRRLNRDIAAHDQADRLRFVMAAYQRWLAGLDEVDRGQLLDLPVNERVDRISTLREDERQELQARTAVAVLSDEDRNVIRDWYRELIRAFAPRNPDSPDGHRRPDRGRPPRSRRGGERRRFDREFDRNLFDSISDDDIQDLQSKLSVAANQQLRAAANKKELIVTWIRGSRPSFREPTREELRSVFENQLTEEERKELERLMVLDLDRAEFYRRLTRIYWRKKFERWQERFGNDRDGRRRGRWSDRRGDRAGPDSDRRGRRRGDDRERGDRDWNDDRHD